MKKVVILGSTGSIGESTIRLARALPDKIDIVGLAADRNVGRLLEQAAEFGVKQVALADPSAAEQCSERASGIEVLAGKDGLSDLAAAGADIVLCAVVGMAGLEPVIAALAKGTDVALATKEVLVAAGELVTETARLHNARILPVDSEHSAVFQCLAGHDMASVRRILLTASGGPFGAQPDIDLDKVTVEEALNHPNWDMGRKVTVDSATLMNKGLEIMEAHWLFGLPLEAIDVVLHPESIVHSIVEFIDGAMISHMGLPDMRFAIQYALTYPERVDAHLPRLNLADVGALTFLAPDEQRFPCLRLAREAGRAGGTMPAVLNAANEVAVQKFLDGDASFSDIWRTVEGLMNRHAPVPRPTLEDILAADAWARQQAGGATGKGT
jgi:1-deoxy-D-xylulose-5-phosphate reductoisomerase